MSLRKISLIFLLLLSLLLSSCQPAKESDRGDKKLKVIATIFPIYDFACNIGGDKIKVTMLLPPGTDAHHYELKPEDIKKVSKADIFLFTNFEMEQWAYKIINAAEKNTNMLAVETGAGAVLLPFNEEDGVRGEHGNHISKFDPHLWLDLDNAQKMVDNIAATFIKKDSRNSDYYLRNARDYKLKLTALDQRYRTELNGCKTKIILHAGHWAFAYLAKRYNIKYVAAYNISADAEPSPQKTIALIEQVKSQKVPYIYYEDMISPRLARMIAAETGAGLLKLNNGHDLSKEDIKNGASFISLMETNLTSLKKGMRCP
ncbi:MAG: zinc-binding protein [Deltaproteobacteria bacterium HGW-Deltaproteobacteria-2]|jgi:zinc transport system substrate-binding protein|nr:MAG: zinc-binding protein [Deltaproteobacteria bacterium HGW-Deltaproteobacteria-2]